MIIIKWQSADKTWNDLDLSGINHLPVSHACHLFSGKIPVIAKQAGSYIVNTPELMEQYKKAGKKCRDFASLLAGGGLDQPLEVAGFLNNLQ